MNKHNTISDVALTNLIYPRGSETTLDRSLMVVKQNFSMILRYHSLYIYSIFMCYNLTLLGRVGEGGGGGGAESARADFNFRELPLY